MPSASPSRSRGRVLDPVGVVRAERVHEEEGGALVLGREEVPHGVHRLLDRPLAAVEPLEALVEPEGGREEDAVGDRARPVAGAVEHLGERRRLAAEPARATDRPGLVGVEPREERAVRRQRPRRDGEGVGEGDRALGEGVQVRRDRGIAPVELEVVGAERVRDEEDQVGAPRGGCGGGTSPPDRRCEERRQGRVALDLEGEPDAARCVERDGVVLGARRVGGRPLDLEDRPVADPHAEAEPRLGLVPGARRERPRDGPEPELGLGGELHVERLARAGEHGDPLARVGAHADPRAVALGPDVVEEDEEPSRRRPLVRFGREEDPTAHDAEGADAEGTFRARRVVPVAPCAGRGLQDRVARRARRHVGERSGVRLESIGRGTVARRSGRVQGVRCGPQAAEPAMRRAPALLRKIELHPDAAGLGIGVHRRPAPTPTARSARGSPPRGRPGGAAPSRAVPRSNPGRRPTRRALPRDGPRNAGGESALPEGVLRRSPAWSGA